MSVYQSAPTPEQAAITAKDFNFWYGDFHALTGKQFAHGSLQSVGCGHAARTVNTHRTRSDRLGTSRTDQPKRPVI